MVPKALITISPFRVSLATRLMRSTKDCMILNLGITNTIIILINPTTQIQANAMTQAIEIDLSKAI